ncbi:MAG: DUF4474 domain-containing protein [Christensenellales bacterium]|jgi:hypothetical protein
MFNSFYLKAASFGLNETTNSGDEITYILFAALFILFVVLIVVKKVLPFSKRFLDKTDHVGTVLPVSNITAKDAKEIEQLIMDAGYLYDQKQDIFYSKLDAWQRDYGYCWLYDEAAAPMSMIVDCEPISFEYDKKRWLIEFWKGQYGLTTGGEVGVYMAQNGDLDIPGMFKGTFYDCAADEDLLHMSFVFLKNGKTLFERSDKHWWLTGFLLGEFSEPSDLTMKISITLKNGEMKKAFITGLKKVGYADSEIKHIGNTVRLVYDRTHVAQPASRTHMIEHVAQVKNRYLCERYQDITKEYASMQDKLNAVRASAPNLYQMIINIGKSKEIFRKFEALRGFVH